MERLWFAGEATSTEYYGHLHGAYYEGRDAGARIAECVRDGATCREQVYYEPLHGTTEAGEYSEANGWTASSFLTYGFRMIKYLTRRSS